MSDQPKEKPREKLNDDQVVPLLKQEFIDGAAYPADVFFRMGENKYILVARQGDKANLAELHVAAKEEVKFLYVRRTDYKNCVGQSLNIAGVIIAKKELPLEKKAVFISMATEAVFKEFDHMGINHETIEHSRAVANNITVLIESKPDLFSVMKMLSALPAGTMRHSMAVSTMSVMIAKSMGWTLQATLEKLAMGALLQDIGLKELPKEIIAKPRHELTADERVTYETHPFRGIEILRSMPSVADDLAAIVYEHHENAIGQGYPRRLRDLKMNPLAKVVAVAEVFCDLSLPHPNNPHPKSPEDAINYMEVTLGHPFNREVFHALKLTLGLKGKHKVA